MSQSNYESVFFESRPTPFRHPSRFGALANLRGGSYRGIESGAFLEIGCSTGRSLLALAEQFPSTQFVGVDLSESQIEIAKQRVEQLKLENIQYICGSAESIELPFKNFATVVMHGVLSWVGRETAEALLRRISEVIDPEHGIALISCNLYPRFGARAALRDLLRSVSGDETDLSKRVAQTRATLAELRTSAFGKSDPILLGLHSEIEHVLERSDEFLVHEILAENVQGYFPGELLSAFERASLRLLALSEEESAVAAGIPESLNAVAGESSSASFSVSEIFGGKAFRNLIVAHERHQWTNAEDRHLSDRTLLCSPIVPKNSHPELHDETLESFVLPSGREISYTSRLFKAALVYLHRTWPEPMPLEELLDASSGLSHVALDDDTREDFRSKLQELIDDGSVEVWCENPQITHMHSVKPRVRKVNLLEVDTSDWITTQRHEYVPIGVFEKKVLPLLDGTRTLEDVTTVLLGEIEAGTFGVKQAGEVVHDAAEQGEIIKEQLQQLVRVLQEHAVLVSD